MDTSTYQQRIAVLNGSRVVMAIGWYAPLASAQRDDILVFVSNWLRERLAAA